MQKSANFYMNRHRTMTEMYIWRKLVRFRYIKVTMLVIVICKFPLIFFVKMVYIITFHKLFSCQFSPIKVYNYDISSSRLLSDKNIGNVNNVIVSHINALGNTQGNWLRLKQEQFSVHIIACSFLLIVVWNSICSLWHSWSNKNTFILEITHYE